MPSFRGLNTLNTADSRSGAQPALILHTRSAHAILLQTSECGDAGSKIFKTHSVIRALLSRLATAEGKAVGECLERCSKSLKYFFS